MKASARKLPIVGALLIGIGLMLAPAIFQMFERAPLGGEMIEEFEPFMTEEQVVLFRGYLAEIDAANIESSGALREQLVASGAVDEEAFDTTFVSIANLNEQWPSIDEDMGDLIDRMENNLDNYAAVAALPPFPMFPWFFVIPGLLIVVASSVALYQRRDGTRGNGRTAVWVVLGLGLAVAAAPVAFQMFDRAPQGRDMIDDFRPMMTRERVQDVQGYFVSLGAAEGQLRVNAIPLVVESGGDAADYPAIAQWSADWPTILTDFNPMVATMSDNVDNYEAVDALPSFALFPWFFVVPGLLVAGLAAVALRARTGRTDDDLSPADDSSDELSEQADDRSTTSLTTTV